ncbi:MAG: hypothetical protein ABWZ40_08620 [Caulobacterales bacterium]
MRVSNNTLNQSMLLELQKTQSAFADAQERVATGKIGNSLKDYGSKAELAASGRLAQARTEQRIALATEVSARFDTQAIVLQNSGDAALNLKQEIMDAIGANNGAGIGAALNSAFQQALSAFNTELNGQYLFAGTRADTPPINITTIDQLGAAPSVASIFTNNTTKPSIDMGNGPIETGQLASDVATNLFQAIKTIKDYIIANGDFGSSLTTAQATFLKAQLSGLDTASSTIIAAEGVNGSNAKFVETQKAHQDDLRIAIGQFVSNVEDADIVDASVKVQQTQLAYEAAAQTLSKLNSLSLLDFLR